MRTAAAVVLVLVVLAASTLSAADGRSARGTVVDSSGQPIHGAEVSLRAGKAERTTHTDARGIFTFEGVPEGRASLLVSAMNMIPAFVDVPAGSPDLRVVMEPAPVSDAITVTARSPRIPNISTATRTETPLRDVPQAVTIISRDVIAQQTMQSMADVVRYIPGVGMAQGEGNRDTPIFRGNASTSDFFVDGVRDDVQYFRDLYNVERVEALKGPNAMIFGRGGVGGVLNRVTRQAAWSPTREVGLEGGSWDHRRVTADFGEAVTDRFAARVTGVYEDSGSYRRGTSLSRAGVNPTVAMTLASNTLVRAGYEFFRDERTADRGISSFNGRPVATDASTFFGNAELSESDATVHALSASIEHRFSDTLTLRSRIGAASYEKFYQNVFPGSVDAAGANVSISAYNNATDRRNLFNQTDLVLKTRTGGVAHTLLGGVELGRQVTANFRSTGYFTSIGADTTSVLVPLASPVTTLPVTFRQSAADADNDGTATIAAVYVQDQVAISPHLQAVAGIRYDRFDVDFRNNRTAATVASSDGLVSPRVGLIYKPYEPLSLYASYTLSYLPRAGEQLSSLSITNRNLDPEEFRNYEVGTKWDVTPSLQVAAAAYRLDRGNVAVPDPLNPAISNLVDGQRSEGIELSVTGNVNDRWSVAGGYAFQDGEITESISSTALKGARLAQLPEHSFSLWNKIDLTARWGAGVGVMHRGEIFTSTDNTVLLPSFTRVDAAVFYNMTSQLRAQLNVENAFDTAYYASAHSNTNITPGSPRAVRLTWSMRF